jgi:GNAT superfamily N-acetyltransferase
VADGKELRIVPIQPEQLDAIVALSMRAWAPVFPLMKKEIAFYVYDAFYPEGWEARQRADVSATCLGDETEIWVAVDGARLVGYVGLRAHAADAMGEVHILAVDPDRQRTGVGRALIEFSFDWMRQKKLKMAIVETGGDQGHAPSRAAYESAGFECYPVARYFKSLDE